MGKVSREQIFTNYNWLRKNSKFLNIIIGDDLDAALSSTLYLHLHPTSRIIGIYKKFTEIYFSRNFFTTFQDLINSPDTIWLDLDIYSRNCKSLGHHVVRWSDKDILEGFNSSLNINELFRISVKHFNNKYPLGTIHFLLWLYDIQIPKQRYADKLIWLADSAFINAQRYKNNVKNWINNIFPMDSIIKTFTKIDRLNFEQDMFRFYNYMIQKHIHLGKSQVKSKNLNLPGYQCNIKKVPEDLLTLTTFIADITGWSFKKKQIHLRNLIRVKGEKGNIKLCDLLSNYKKLENFLIKKNVFSYAIIRQNILSYTSF